MTLPQDGLVLLASEEIDDAHRDELSVTLRLVGRDSVVVGRLLDLIGHAAGLGGIECAIEAPGYRRVFYGWEKAR